MVYGNQNYYGQQWYQPQMPMTSIGQQQFIPQQQLQQQAVPQQQDNSFIWVQGKEAAKAYLVAPGKDVLLMDSDNPYIYMKSTDVNGKPQKMKTYRLVEEFDDDDVEIKSEDVESPEYVKKDEFDLLLNDIKELKSKFQEIGSMEYVKNDDFNLLLNEIKELKPKLQEDDDSSKTVSKTRRSTK